MFENKNLVDIYTPVDATKLRQILEEHNYDKQKTDYLCKGFEEGSLLVMKVMKMLKSLHLI